MTRRQRAGARRSQVNPLVPAFAAVLVVVALVVIVTRADDEQAAPAPSTSTTTATTSPPETTTTTRPEAVPVDVIRATPFEESPPASYRITYEVVENQLTRTETITVRRPYESLVVSARDGELVSGSATSRARLWTYLADREGWLAIQPELHRAAFDHRPLPGMAAAIALGRAEEIGRATYLGRDCRVFRTGQPIGTPGVHAPAAGEFTELCIDGSGLVLHERWEIDGSPVTERTATALETEIDVDPASFDPTPVVEDAEEFDTILSAVAVPADEETVARLQVDIVPPEGYVLDGTVLRAGSPRQGGTAASEIVRFYSNGIDLIEVAEVFDAAGVDLDGGNAVPVEIDGPETWFFADFRASSVRTRLSDTSFVELRGTEPGVLVDLLDTMTRRSG